MDPEAHKIDPAADAAIVRSRVRGLVWGTWMVPVLVLIPLGVIVMFAGQGSSRQGAVALGIGAILIGTTIGALVWALLRTNDVRADAEGITIGRRECISWSSMADVHTTMTMNADRNRLVVTRSAAGLRARAETGRTLRPVEMALVTAEAGALIKWIWRRRAPIPEPDGPVDCYMNRSAMGPFWIAYTALQLLRPALDEPVAWVVVGGTLGAAAALWWAQRDRRVTHLRADESGLEIMGRFGYRLAWSDVVAMNAMSGGGPGAGRITVKMSDAARQRIGWRRFLDGAGTVTFWVPMAVGDRLLRLRERALSSTEPATPTSGAR